jgi:hypothetical protein
VVERPALLDVQLDERPDAGQPLRVGPEAVGVEAGPADRVGQPGALAVLEPQGLGRIEGARHQP